MIWNRFVLSKKSDVLLLGERIRGEDILANFDLSFYSGDDGYSDGDNAENYILEAVKAGKNIDDIPSGEMTWPVFYHLSPIRENICNWYPFKKDASILEIGSGCGAVTGVLCQNAVSVTSVELSKRRASINYERNKNYQNLNIIVGNLNDIKLEEKYDYITLIGVLEYAGRFTEGERPFHAFLMNMKKYLKPDGALLIAIENRLGLKYFSGAPEDHTGRLFDGINGYPDDDGVRTFSRSELSELLGDCGFTDHRFYYPYPDYKLPNEIFTDASINRNKRPYSTYDVDRYSLFWESDLSNVLQREDVAAAFANSFFVETRADSECDSSVIYTKLNQDRKEEFRVGTVIYQEDGKKAVEKKPFHPCAVSHIDRIFENDRKRYGNISAISGEKRGNSIRYPFVEYVTLGDRLKKLALDGKSDELVKLVKHFFGEVLSEESIQAFSDEGFSDVFGDSSLPEKEVKCVCPANIDLSPANVYCDGDEYYISDCEWVFDFPIPASFVVWRAIRALYVNIPAISKAVKEKELLLEMGVDESYIDVFKKWEAYFIEEYVCSKGQGIPKSNKFKSIVYGDEERLIQTVHHYEGEIDNYKQSILSYEAQAEGYRQDIQRHEQLYEQQEERFMKHLQDYEAQAESYRQDIQRYEAQTERYRNDIQLLNNRVAQLEAQDVQNRNEINRVKERVNYLLGRINMASQLIATLSNLRAFKMMHLLKRIKEQLIRGNKEERAGFFRWLRERDGNANPDPTYNYLLQLDSALHGSGDYSQEYIQYACNIDLKGAKRIDIITPGHTLFLARQLSSYLQEAGIASEIHDPEFSSFEEIPYIIICANIMKQLPPCYICYQMEQTINSRWLTDKYIGVLENAQAVLDYSQVNTGFFNDYDRIKEKLYYVPMGVNEDDIKGAAIPGDQDIDVLFYGDINCERRKKIIEELGRSFNVHVESDLFGEEMLDVIKRSKVVINIHYYEGALLETPRIVEILSLGTSIILSERSNDPDEEKRIGDLVDFVDVDDVDAMRKRISFWLENSDERKKKLEDNRKRIIEGDVDSKKYFEEFLRDQGI